jgi:DNA-binding transcriptional MerR regulator
MARYLTVSELVDRCAPVATSPSDEEPEIDEDRRRIWLRRARHWSDMDILSSAPASRNGTGHHRRYQEKDVFIAAVLLRISDLGVSFGVTRDIAGALRLDKRRAYVGEDFPKTWRQAISGKPPGIYHLATWISHEGIVFVDAFGPEQRLGSLDRFLDIADAPMIVVSLTRIFEIIRRYGN